MKFIPTLIHGVMDYLVGIILIISPWLFNFANGGAETTVPVALGIAAIVYSLLTYYELGLAKVLTMRTHLWLDAASGILLALSPWLFNFADTVYMPHVIFGLLEIVVAAITDPIPGKLGTKHSRSQTEIHDWS